MVADPARRVPIDPASGLRTLICELHGALGRLEVAVSLARDAKAWTDREGRLVWCNPAFDRLIDADHVRLLGARLVEILPLRRDHHPIAEIDHPATRALADAREATGTYELVLADREAIVEIYARPGLLQGEPYCVLVVADITARERAQRELGLANARLEAANAELEAFSYSVSHDLRTPLRALDGFSHALLDDYADALDDRGKDYLQRIRNAAQNMARLIDDLLRLSRVTRADVARTTVDVSAMCREIVDELAAGAPDRRVDVAIADAITVRADARLLRQALVNLIENAWKFTGKTADARIEIGARHDPGALVIFVRDNGAGFDMTRADKLFGAFQRLHTVDEFPGLGIGLAIVRRVAHRHGGRVWAEAAEGRGATFYLGLPTGGEGPG